MTPLYRIIDLRTLTPRVVTLEEAAEIAELSEDEIAWALEEEGICETDLHVIAEVDDAGDGAPDTEHASC